MAGAVVRQQHGFTLLELMVAMMIFAMLAVSGWQVFDSVNRARERAQLQADNLAVLQYAYLQLQQDMGQVLAYQASTANNSADNSINVQPSEQNIVLAEPFMSLSGEQLKMMRYADPDPRYQTSPTIQRVEYIFSDQRLIRRQYSSTQSDSVGLDTVVLEGVTEGRWQAYLPELSASFPNTDRQNNNSNNSNALDQASNAAATDEPNVALLPKGVSISFTYQEIPITWQFALSAQSAPNNSKASSSGDNSNGNSSNDDSANGNFNNNGNNFNDNDASTTNPTLP